MPYTRVLFRSQARQKVLNGVNTLADAVRVTLGPKSKCVLSQRRFGPPIVCNDGVTIAKEMHLEDANEDLGAQMIRQAAERTGDAVGDGTSTSTILAQASVTDGIRNVVAGASAIDLKRGLDRGVKVAIEALNKLSRPVKSRLEKAQVGTISAHNDPSIGAMVAQAMERVGDEGVITVEESKTTETQLEVVEGLQFDRGYVSPYFVTDAEKMEAVLETPVVLLYDGKLTVMKDLLPLLEQVARGGHSLLVVAQDIRVVSPEIGVKLENVDLSYLGRCQRIVAEREATTIVAGAGDKQAIEGRKKELRTRIDKATSDYDREKLQERLAKLSGGVAVVRVGAPSEAEMKSRKEAFDDAIHATKAAVAEGIVPECGLALLRMITAVEAEEAAVQGTSARAFRS
jgi:chaperonin GroEL